jgi:putative protease
VGNYRRGEALIAGQLSQTAEQAGYPKQCIPVMPVVSHDGDENRRSGFDVWKRVKEEKPVLVQNLGQVIHAANLGAEVEIGPFLPITNRIDLQLAHDLGAQRVWLSPELTVRQIEELGEVSPVPLGVTIMGYTELMVTEHCLLMSQGPCSQDCDNCARRKSPHYLKDRKGYELPVITDSFGRSHLYNAVELDVAHAAPELISAGISAFMVDTTLMNVEQVTKKVARAVRARDIALKRGDCVSRAQETTTGHLFRGVS